MFDVSQDRQLNHLRKASKKTYHSVLHITIILPSNLMYLHMFKRHVGLFKLKLHKRTPHGSSVGQDPIPPPRCHLQPGEGSNGVQRTRGDSLGGRSLPTGPYSKRCPKTLLASEFWWDLDFLLFFCKNCIHLSPSQLTISKVSKVSTQSEESNCFWPQPWFSYSFGASLLKVTGKMFHDLPCFHVLKTSGTAVSDLGQAQDPHVSRDPWQLDRTSRDSLHEPSSSWQDRPADLLPTPCQKSQRLCPHFVGPSNVKGLKN